MATTARSDGSLQQHAPNDAEAAILSKCQTQSLLVGGMYMTAGLVGIRFLGPALLRNSWSKSKLTRRLGYAAGGFFGFSSGVASYTPRCAQMLMQLDDSPIADELRKHMAAQQSANYGQRGVSIDRNSGASGSGVDMDRASKYQYGQRGVTMDDREYSASASSSSSAASAATSSAAALARTGRDAQQDAPASQHPFATKSLAKAAAEAKATGKLQEREVVDMLTLKKKKVLIDEHGRLTPVEDDEGGADSDTRGGGYMARVRERQRRAAAASAAVRDSERGNQIQMDDSDQDGGGGSAATEPAAKPGWRKRDITGKEVAWANSRTGRSAANTASGARGGGAATYTDDVNDPVEDGGEVDVWAFPPEQDGNNAAAGYSDGAAMGGSGGDGEVFAFPEDDGGWSADGSGMARNGGGSGAAAARDGKMSYAERRVANRAAVKQQQEQQALERRRKREESREQARVRSRERRTQQQQDGNTEQYGNSTRSSAQAYN
eukprot:gene763-12169_t